MANSTAFESFDDGAKRVGSGVQGGRVFKVGGEKECARGRTTAAPTDLACATEKSDSEDDSGAGR